MRSAKLGIAIVAANHVQYYGYNNVRAFRRNDFKADGEADDVFYEEHVGSGTDYRLADGTLVLCPVDIDLKC